MDLKRYIYEIVRKEFLDMLIEKTVTDNFYTLDNIVNLIILDANDENLSKKDYQFSENGINVKIRVFFNKEEYCGWYDDWSNVLIIYVETKPNFYNVKAMISHELTHKIDDKREKENRNKFFRKNSSKNYKPIMGRNFYPKGSGYETVKSNCPINEYINNILYRLWSKTERNAYISNSYLGMDFCNEYINSLKDEIDKIEESNIEDNIDCWVELHKVLYYNNEIKNIRPDSYVDGLGKHNVYDTDISLNRCKKYFIKKSRYLLEIFSKKLLKNCMNNAYLKRNNS